MKKLRVFHIDHFADSDVGICMLIPVRLLSQLVIGTHLRILRVASIRECFLTQKLVLCWLFEQQNFRFTFWYLPSSPNTVHALKSIRLLSQLVIGTRLRILRIASIRECFLIGKLVLCWLFEYKNRRVTFWYLPSSSIVVCASWKSYPERDFVMVRGCVQAVQPLKEHFSTKRGSFPM